MDLLKINASIVKVLLKMSKKYANDSMIIPVTNPLIQWHTLHTKYQDLIKAEYLEWEECLIYQDLDNSFEATGHSSDSIRAKVIGEHGENMLPLPRFSSVSWNSIIVILTKFLKLDQLVQSPKTSCSQSN